MKRKVVIGRRPVSLLLKDFVDDVARGNWCVARFVILGNVNFKFILRKSRIL